MHDLSTDDVGLNRELRSSFHNFTRMSSADFELLINLLGPKIAKKNTNYGEANVFENQKKQKKKRKIFRVNV